MSGLTWFRIAVCAVATGLLVSCAEVPTPPNTSATAPAPTPMPGYFEDDGGPGEPKIVVSISEQRAYFYKGKRLIGESTVSTGKAGFSTPPGNYKVVWKHADHVSTRFGDYVDGFGNVIKSNVDSAKDERPPGTHFDGARMPFAMFFRGGYAMHQGYVPPFAASHGCIRLPQGMAELFFNAAPYGTPVIVKQEAVMRTATVRPPNPDPAAAAVVRPATAPVYASVRAPAPGPGVSPAPPPIRSNSVRSAIPSPTPASIYSTKRGPVRPAPSPTPTATPARSSLRPRAM